MNLPQSAPRIRAAFRSAVAAAGWDFRSDRLWEMYADWERDQGDPRAATAVYDRVLSVPTQLYNQHFHRFKELVSSHSPREILSAAEFLELRSEVMQGCAAVTPDPDGGGAEGPPGEEGPPGLTAGEQETDEHEEKIRELLVARRQEVYESNEVEVSKRWSFEEAIKRPYFHVKPLDRAQLRNWHSYLDFEMEAESGAGLGVESGAGSGGRAGLLFERCLVACALYEEFWSKYAKFQAQRSVDGARSVFRRACEIHLPRKPSMHLLWAAFEEQQGNLEEARRVLEALDQSVPGLAMVRLRRASLERRAGNLEGAESLLREAVLQSQATPLRSFYSIKLARQLLRVQRDHGKARRVLQDAIDRDPLLDQCFSLDVHNSPLSPLCPFMSAVAVFSAEPYVLIMEYVSFGTLKSFLKTHRAQLSDTPELQSLLTIAAYHIALAMEHIRSKMVVHCDLGLRNILLGRFPHQCKVAEFGLARDFSRFKSRKSSRKKHNMVSESEPTP
ncbi:UNVERIFIED_CONTAM: hypothetical protein FKN15_067097 [Acipenser sinensis]